MARSYDMTRRSKSAGRTLDAILDSAERLLASVPIADITLRQIADDAGVTVQTVLRRTGSRDGCFAAVGRRMVQRVDEQRGRTPQGDLPAAIAALCRHYETDGRLVLQLLGQESRDPLAAKAVEQGRTYHREWVLRCFGPLLRGAGDAEADEQLVDQLVAATDLYVWKLLRLDLQRSAHRTEQTIAAMVSSIIARGTPPGMRPDHARIDAAGPAERGRVRRQDLSRDPRTHHDRSGSRAENREAGQ